MTNGITSLSWKTTNEVNIRGFEIERSNDGINFSKISVVQATGMQNNQYNSTDLQPKSGNNYYRLKMVDNDGKFSYSAILLVKAPVTGKLQILTYPNPVKDQLIISPSGITGTISIHIVNQQGRVVLSRQIAAATTTISVESLSKGIYMIQLSSNGLTETHKLVKE